MKGTDKHEKTVGPEPESDALIELFRHASARQRPPAADEQIVRQALHDQWQAMSQHKRRRRTQWTWALAASVVLVSVIGIRLNDVSNPIRSGQQLAVTEKVIGSVSVRSASGSLALQNNPGQMLLAGQIISTSSGSKLALRWLNGIAIRIDELSELRLAASNEVFLVSGRIYMDTEAADFSATVVSIMTPRGEVRHLGTQFMTQVSATGISVSVREGEVVYFPSVDNEEQRTLASAGQQLSVVESGQAVLEPVSTWGADWEWVESLSSGFSSDGRSVADLLAWAGRESGRQVQYRSDNAQTLASSTVLHGDMDLKPTQAVAVATATSDLNAEINEGFIIVGLSVKD